MQNYRNIPVGFSIPNQTPLDRRTVVQNEATLKDQTTISIRAMQYHKAMKFICIAENTAYEWLPKIEGKQGLLTYDWVYPTNMPVVDNIDYNNQIYNLYKIEYLTPENINDLIQIYTMSNVGTGAKIYKTDSSNNFKLKTLISSNLNIIEDDETISINIPAVEGGLRMFHVNENYTGSVEEGSTVKPYKRLIKALREVVNAGTLTNPAIKNVNIILQSNVSITQEELNSLTALKNKLNINTLTYSSDDSLVKRTIQYQGVEDYPIDMRTVINEIGKDSNGNLNSNYYFSMFNINLIVTNIQGVAYFKNSENLTSNLNTIYNNMDNVSFICNYYPSEYYTTLKNPDNSTIYFYGNPVKGQSSIALTTPHVIVEGFDRLNSGETQSFKNCRIKGSSQKCLLLRNTVVNSELTVGYDGNFQNYSTVAGDIYKYVPKSDLSSIEIINSHVQGYIKEDSSYPSYTQTGTVYPDLNNKIGGVNEFIKITRTSDAPSTIPNSINLESWIFSLTSNYFITIDFNASFAVYNSDLTGLNILKSAFNPMSTFSSLKQINANGTIINKVLSEVITKIRLNAITAQINGSEYSSSVSYVNEAAAIAAGLIPGNYFLNSSTNSLTKIEFP